MLNPEEATTHTKRGASSQSWRTANPRGLLGSLMTKYPKKEGQSESDYRDQMLDTFSNLALDNNKMLLSIIEYWFTNNYRSLLAAQHVDENVVRERARMKEAETKRMRDTVETAVKRKARTMLLDLMMPNGKRLRSCTGKECNELSRTAGRWLAAIGKEIKPTQKVGEALSEDRLHELYNVART